GTVRPVVVVRRVAVLAVPAVAAVAAVVAVGIVPPAVPQPGARGAVLVHLMPARPRGRGPLPGVAGHLEETEAVRREAADGRGVDPPAGARVEVREAALPAVRTRAVVRLIPPRVPGAV